MSNHYLNIIGILLASCFLCQNPLHAQVSGNNPEALKSTPDTAGNVKTYSTVPILYGEQPKNKLLQSVATVYTDQLTTTPSAQILQALPGRLSGLNISFSSGGPGLDGSGINYNIRGARAQLILIDGVERGYLSLDPEEIESISVLKDALSTVMFGQRSSYGIISIKTKKGDKGKPRFSFTAQSGIETPVALPKPLAAWQHASLYNEGLNIDNLPGTRYRDTQIDTLRNQLDPYNYPDVDWYGTVLNKRAMINRYNFNVQGSGKGFRYFVDLDNLKEEGLFKTIDSNKYNTNSQLERYILRSNLGAEITKSTFLQVNLFGRFQRYNQPGGGATAILSSLLTTPQNAYPVTNPNGTLGASSSSAQNANIYGQAVNRGYMFQDAKDMALDVEVNQKLDVITPGLYIKGQGSYNNTTYYTTTRAKNFATWQYNLNGMYTSKGTASEQTTTGAANERYRVIYAEGSLGYDKNFGRHSLSALAIANQQSRLTFSTTNLPENYTAYAGRVNYSYDDKYLVEAAGSYAGYNWLTPSQRWAPYWAAGIGWNLHNEGFIKDHVKMISNLKLRANYGTTGQANAGYYTYIQTYFNPSTNTNNGVAYHWGSGSSLERGVGENAIANPSLGPEKAKKLDAGADLGFWNNRLTITADYFYNKYYDLVAAPVATTAILGAGYPLQNYQKFDYRGTDLSATWQDKIKDFNYYITANYSVVQSEVIFNAELPKDYDYQRSTGRQVGLQYGYTATGLFRSTEEINDPNTAVLSSTPKSSLRPGDIRYLDRNGDGVININDQGAIGSGKPTVYYGATLGFSFKGFDLSALVQGTMNRQSYISGDFMNGFGSSGNFTGYEYNLGRFTTATAATATQPRIWLGNNTNNQQTSSFWLKDNDFIRLKNVEVGYTVPEKWSRKIRVPSIRVFSNGLNLLTYAEIHNMRRDMDPEAWGGVYPIMKVVNFGINVKF